MGSTPARADGDGEREQARAHFRQGLRHYNLGEFEPALEEFKASYRLQDDPALLYNVGQCEWKLGRLDAAVRSYRALLRMRPDAGNRAEVERRIGELEAKAREQSGRQEAPGSVQAPLPSALVPRNDAQAPAAAGMSMDRSAADPSARAPEQAGSKKWVLWVLGGAVLLAGSATIVLTQSRGTSIPRTDLGAQGVFR